MLAPSPDGGKVAWFLEARNRALERAGVEPEIRFVLGFSTDGGTGDGPNYKASESPYAEPVAALRGILRSIH